MPRGWSLWGNGAICTHVASLYLFCVRKKQCTGFLLISLLGRRAAKGGIVESSNWDLDKATRL